MDPFSLTAGALQIAGACATCTVTIIKIVGDIRSVDNRIGSFCDEVSALRGTYEGLEKSLSSPLLLEAARVASQSADGANLWKQIKDALDDSKRTMRRVNEILSQITRTSGFARRIKAHLTESLHSGELSRMRQRIQFFNAALSLPIQMVCVMLQLEQRGMTSENHASLDLKLVSLERAMTGLVEKLNSASPSRVHTLGGATIVAAHEKDQDDGMKTYVAFAKRFLTTASAAASVRSSLSTISPAIEPELLGATMPATADPTQTDRDSRVDGWIQVSASSNLSPQGTPGNDPRQTLAKVKSQLLPEDLEVEFMRTKQHLRLGQENSEQQEWAKAERHFRRALILMRNHDFDGRISLQPAEVVLLLAECCMHQDKFEDAATLLQPIAEMRPDIFPDSPSSNSLDGVPTHVPLPDKLQSLAASHLLGRVFMLKGDFCDAEKHGLRAFTERRKDLGARDEKTIESVQLVIEIYKTRGEDGDEEEADVYEIFLSPPEETASSTPTERLLTPLDPPIPAAVVPFEPGIPQLPYNQQRGLRQRLRHLGRSSQSGIGQVSPLPDLQRLSISRATTLNEVADPACLSPPGLHALQSPSITSQERTLSINDDSSVTTPPSMTLERSSSSKVLEPTFRAISDLCRDGKESRAVKIALSYLNTYQSKFMIIREPELKDNIRNGLGRGLARTGKGYSALHFFCELREECADEVNMLVQYGVDVNAIAFQAGYTQSNPKDPFTALQVATERGFSRVTAILLSVNGVKTDVRDLEGYTPLMVACRRGHHRIVSQLLAFPLPTEFPQTWHGNTLLHDASRRCDSILVQMLLGHHPDIDQRDRFGKTALMHAVVKADISDPAERRRRIKGRCRTVQVLLEAGADPTLSDHRTQKSVRRYAMEEDDAELMMLLDQIPRTSISELVA